MTIRLDRIAALRQEEMMSRSPRELFGDALGRLDRVCQRCGATFTVDRHSLNKVYCGVKCQQAAYRPPVELDPIRSECVYCKRTIVHPRRGKLYCDKTCKHRAWQERAE